LGFAPFFRLFLNAAEIVVHSPKNGEVVKQEASTEIKANVNYFRMPSGTFTFSVNVA
jgi:hypothetical protein